MIWYLEPLPQGQKWTYISAAAAQTGAECILLASCPVQQFANWLARPMSMCLQAEEVNKAMGSGNDAAVSGRGALYERLVDAQHRQEQACAQATNEETANAAVTSELRAARAEVADLKMRIA